MTTKRGVGGKQSARTFLSRAQMPTRILREAAAPRPRSKDDERARRGATPTAAAAEEDETEDPEVVVVAEEVVEKGAPAPAATALMLRDDRQVEVEENDTEMGERRYEIKRYVRVIE